jgi:hypothetical protein
MSGWPKDMTPTMTLGEGMRWLHREPFGCACIGPPWCCMDVDRQAARLHRAAHIVAKLVAEYAQPKEAA